MHELSLAQGLLDQLTTLADIQPNNQNCCRSVAVGRQAGIVVDSFCFGFDALKKNYATTKDASLELTDTEGTELILSQVEME